MYSSIVKLYRVIKVVPELRSLYNRAKKTLFLSDNSRSVLNPYMG